MSTSNQSSSGPSDATESDDGNDPLDIFIRHAISREPSPLQYVQLVHPLGHLGLTSWPMLTPMRVQLMKCDRCSREFCSPMNYRRHILMHRRSSNVDKESQKNRDLLGAFWDKLSVEEAANVTSLDDISLEGVPGLLIVNELASSINKVGMVILPQNYLHAGCILLELIRTKSGRPPIYSPEVFSILDETSERTFLSAGTAESVQKFVVDGEAEKAIEIRNLIASAGLLFEQKLVKAWLAEKDVEALRCQKILVEEEEVAQKRQAQALEKKRRKKLRQKEQKTRGQTTGEKTDNNAVSLESIADFIEGSALAETSIPKVPFHNGPDTLTDLKSSPEQIDFSGKEDEGIVVAPRGYSSTHVGMDSIQSVGSPKERATNGLSQPSISTWKVVKSYRRGQLGLLGSQHLQASKLEGMQKQGAAKDMNFVANSGKIWSRNSKSAIDEWSSRITVQNKVAKNANDVKSSKTSLQHVVAKGAIDVESSRTALQNVVAKSSNDEESSRTTLQNIVSKGEIDVQNSRTTWKNVVAKSAIDLESSRTSLQNVKKDAISVESSRKTSHNVVAESTNDVKGSRTSLRITVSKGATDLEDSRTTLQNVVTKSANDVKSSRTSLQNVGKGAIDVVSSKTTFPNVVAKGANGVESSRTGLQNVAKGGVDVESSRTTLQNVVAESTNDVRGSITSLRITVSKGATDVEDSRTTLQNVVAKSANDAKSSRTSVQKVEKGAIDVVSSKTTLQNIVAKSAKGVESSRTSLQSLVPSHIDPNKCKLLIGSISVPLRTSTAEQHVSQGKTTDSSDNSVKSDVVLKGLDPAVAMTGNICVYEMGGNLHIQMGNGNCGEKNIPETVEDQTATPLQSPVSEPNVTIKQNPYTERNVQLSGSVFPHFDVKAFLSQRWEHAIASDHVKLVLSPESPHDADARKDCSLPVQTSGCSQDSKLGDAETSVAGVESRVSINENSKAKFRNKDKGVSRMKHNQGKDI